MKNVIRNLPTAINAHLILQHHLALPAIHAMEILNSCLTQPDNEPPADAILFNTSNQMKTVQ